MSFNYKNGRYVNGAAEAMAVHHNHKQTAMMSLRAKNKSPGRAPIAHRLKQAACSISGVIAGLFTLRAVSKKNNVMCNNYGHVIDKSAWTATFPRCVDCGIEIRAADQLRTCIPKSLENK